MAGGSAQTKRLLFERSCPRSGLRIVSAAAASPFGSAHPWRPIPLAPSLRGKGNVKRRGCAPSLPEYGNPPSALARCHPLSKRGRLGVVNSNAFSYSDGARKRTNQKAPLAKELSPQATEDCLPPTNAALKRHNRDYKEMAPPQGGATRFTPLQSPPGTR